MYLQETIVTPRGAALWRIWAESRYVAPRFVDIWAPPGASGPLPVLYMHDGQNLFMTGEAFGGEPWGVDAALEALVATGRLSGAIVVGVWNTARRWREYGPQQPLEALRGTTAWNMLVAQAGGELIADAYVDFLVAELKPFVDATVPTLASRADTFVMGSSMGGLISLYALERYPAVFGGAACLSTHWPAGGALLVDAMADALPAPGAHRLYFDYGTRGLDAQYEPLQRRMDARLAAAGYTPGHDWVTRAFPGADHNEASWRERLHIPLAFLLGR